MNNYIVNKVLSTFLIIQMLFIVLISRHPEWVEKYYSNGLYPFISRLLRKLLGWIPISVGDLLYLLFVFIVLKWLWYLFQTRL